MIKVIEDNYKTLYHTVGVQAKGPPVQRQDPELKKVTSAEVVRVCIWAAVKTLYKGFIYVYVYVYVCMYVFR